MSAETTRASTVIDYVNGETRKLRAEWSILTKKGPAFPQFTWEDLLEALLDLTKSELEEMAIRGALGCLLKTSQFKPAELVLQELMILASSTSELRHRQTQSIEEGGSMV